VPRLRHAGGSIASALPGSTTEPKTIPQFRDRLESYRDITPKSCGSISPNFWRA